MLGWKQVRFVVLPVLAPAVLEGLGLMLLRQTGNEIGVAGGEALLNKGLSYVRDQLHRENPTGDIQPASAMIGVNLDDLHTVGGRVLPDDLQLALGRVLLVFSRQRTYWAAREPACVGDSNFAGAVRHQAAQ